MRILTYISFLFLLSCTAGKPVYMFTSFNEPASEGLRFLYSYDGYKWTDAGRTFVKPEVGSKVMRDPSIARGADGTYQLIWTSGWMLDRLGRKLERLARHMTGRARAPVRLEALEDRVVEVRFTATIG